MRVALFGVDVGVDETLLGSTEGSDIKGIAAIQRCHNEGAGGVWMGVPVLESNRWIWPGVGAVEVAMWLFWAKKR